MEMLMTHGKRANALQIVPLPYIGHFALLMTAADRLPMSVFLHRS